MGMAKTYGVTPGYGNCLNIYGVSVFKFQKGWTNIKMNIIMGEPYVGALDEGFIFGFRFLLFLFLIFFPFSVIPLVQGIYYANK